MLGFSVLSTLFSGIAALASGKGVLAAATAILFFSSTAGLTALWSSAAYQAAILSATACVVMVDTLFYDVDSGLTLLRIYFEGCLLPAALSVTAWLIYRYMPCPFARRYAYSSVDQPDRGAHRSDRLINEAAKVQHAAGS
jgi:hypothetical protein